MEAEELRVFTVEIIAGLSASPQETFSAVGVFVDVALTGEIAAELAGNELLSNGAEWVAIVNVRRHPDIETESAALAREMANLLQPNH